jgi:hypothetical protein
MIFTPYQIEGDDTKEVIENNNIINYYNEDNKQV